MTTKEIKTRINEVYGLVCEHNLCDGSGYVHEEYLLISGESFYQVTRPCLCKKERDAEINANL